MSNYPGTGPTKLEMNSNFVFYLWTKTLQIIFQSIFKIYIYIYIDSEVNI